MADLPLPLVLDVQLAARQGSAGLARRQQERLAELVTWARTRSPAYRARYRRLPDRVEDSTLLPVVDKATLMAEFDDWVTDPARIGQPFHGHYTVATTSGTTGTRGLFLVDRRSFAVAGAVLLRAMTGWLTAGDLVRIIRGGGRMTTMMATGGHFATAVAAARLRAHPVQRRLVSVLSVHQPLPELVEELNRLQPAIVAPYASVAALLAGEADAGRLRIRPSLIVLAAEGLPPGQYGRVAAAFPTATVVPSYAATKCPFLSAAALTGGCTHQRLGRRRTFDHRPVPAGELSDTVLISNLVQPDPADPALRPRRPGSPTSAGSSTTTGSTTSPSTATTSHPRPTAGGKYRVVIPYTPAP